MDRPVLAMNRAQLAARTGIAVVVLALCGAGSAGAHTAQILIQDSTLVYQQFPGISIDYNNDVTISEKTDETGTYYVIEDPESTGMFFPGQCTPLVETDLSVRCPAAGISGLYVRTGNAAIADPTRHSSVTITAPTPATLSGGSATVDAGTSNVTAGPVGGNVLYGSLGGGALDSKNGFIDMVHTCPANTVEPDFNDILIPDCAVIPEPPGTPPPASPGSPSSPSSPSQSKPGSQGTAPPVQLSPPGEQSATVQVVFNHPQAVLGRRYIVLTVSVATALTVRVRATIALPGSHRSVTLVGRTVRLGTVGATATLRLLVPRAALRALHHAFARHRHLYANVQVEATDAASLTSFALDRLIQIVP